jgi:hypothetical protein
VSGSIAGLIVGLILGLSSELRSGLSDKLIGGLLFTLTFGVIGGLGIGSLNHVTLVEAIGWKWNQFWKKTIPGSVFGLILGLSGGGGLRIEPSWLINCLIFGLTGGLVSGLIGGFTDRAKAGKVSPNQGIKLSRKNSLTVFLVTWLISGLIGVIGGLGSGRGLIFGLINGLLFGLIFALIAGLNRGGSAVIKHYALRLILWRRGYTPLNFIKFLDQCARLILLKKLGGGYIFIHQMLLDYFAALTPEKKPQEAAKIMEPQ